MKQLTCLLTIVLSLWALAAIGQSRTGSRPALKADTLYSRSRDTLTVRAFRKDGRIRREEGYASGKLISVKNWYYYKWFFGYRLTDKTSPEPRLEYRKEFFTDGKLRIEGTALKGKKQGKFKTYYRNGQLQCDCNFKAGKPDRLQTKYFDNGQVMLVSSFRDGKEHGKSTYYFYNGQLRTERLHLDDKSWTALSSYDTLGNPVEKGTLREGNGTLFIYNENGKLTAVEHYREGKRIRTEKKE